MKASGTQSVEPPGFVLTDQSNSVAIDWFGTVRGKLGYTAGRWLVFGTGGLAYGRPEASGLFVNVTNPRTWSGSVGSVKAGWTAGGGIDYGLTNHWIVGVEYLFVDFGGVSYLETSATAVPFQQFFITNRIGANIVRASLDYRF